MSSKAGTARRRGRRALAAAGLVGAGLIAPAGVAGAAVVTVRVSVTSGGTQAGGASTTPSMSADGGVVAFVSASADLVAGDGNGVADVFVHDRRSGATTRVTVGAGGGEADGPSAAPAVSADGRWVAFESTATNLVAVDGNATSDVFVHDRMAATTVRVSVATGGSEAQGGASSAPAISGDGAVVAFASGATNLVSGDTNGSSDVFVHDLRAGVTTLVSGAVTGTAAGGPSREPALSRDGRVVAFTSEGIDLVAGDTNGQADVFLHDRVSSTTTRGSVATGGTEAVGGPSTAPALSADGSVVAFVSAASNLVAGDTNGAGDVFVRHRPGGTTTRGSVRSGGGQSRGGAASPPALSGDGRFVTFDAAADDLVAGDTNGARDVFVHDRIAVTTSRASATAGGGQAGGDSAEGSTSDDGRLTAYASSAGDLVAGDTNGVADVFLTDRLAPDPPATGYRLVAADGGIFAFGSAGFFGSTGALRLNSPIVTMAPAPDGRGYWLVAADGGIFAFGSAAFSGSTGALRLNRPIVAMAPTPSGRGYWLAASDGGIFAFGDAGFHGSAGALRLNRPIVGMAATPSGLGYWLAASDGGIFAFGDARFFGSSGALPLNEPIVGMAASSFGNGYWLVARDGGIFAFGSAGFSGSTGALRLNRPIVALAATTGGGGYWLVASDGGIFAFGDARFLGSTGGRRVNQPIVGMAAG